MSHEAHDVVALKLASACWQERLDTAESPQATELLRQMDAILEFLPCVPKPLQSLMTDRAWCLLSTAIQISPPVRFPSA